MAGPDAFTVGIWHAYTLTKPASGCPTTDMIPVLIAFWLDLRLESPICRADSLCRRQ